MRWNRGSLRLRLTPDELATIVQGAEIAEELCLPSGMVWRVSLAIGVQTTLLSDEDAVHIILSAADRERLAAPDAEGVYFQTPDGLRYYIEKDFPCAHPRAAEALEPVTGTFAAPPGFEERKQETETDINGD